MISPEMLPLLAAALAAASVAAIAFVIIGPMLSGDSAEDTRKRSVTETRAVKSAKLMASQTTATRRKAVTDSLKDIENRQKASKKLTTKIRLERAGIKAPARVYWIWSVAVGAALALVSFVALGGSGLALVLTPLCLFVGTFGLPRLWLNRRIKKRQFKFTAELANAVDLIVRGIKAGLPLNECLQMIARESPEPIASEFKEVVEQQRVGVTLGEALERLSVRMPTAEVRFFAIVISIQQQAGGNLSEALGNLAGVLRDRAKLALKVKAMSSEAKAGAMVLGSLPPLVCTAVTLMSPKYMLPLFNTIPGNFILLCALLWMGTGVLVMKKMIAFKF